MADHKHRSTTNDYAQKAADAGPVAEKTLDDGPSQCDKCCEWWRSTCPGHFLSTSSSHVFNLFFAHLLFWTLAIPKVLKHGYVSSNYADALAAKGDWNQIESGRWGQGAFPVILAVTIVATLIFGQSLASYLSTFGCGGKPEEE